MPPPKRPSRSRGFTQIPNERAAAGYKALRCPQAMIWNYIHYRAWADGVSTIPLANQTLAAWGVSRQMKYRGLRYLERAGLVRVEYRGRRSPLVTLL
jgi:hypothetical protein